MWVLIIAVLTNDGNAITSVRFSNEAACNGARAYVLQNMKPERYGRIEATCFPEHIEVK